MQDTHIALPNAFLPAADRYNLSSKLDRWVITETFKWIYNHPAHLEHLSLCAINLLKICFEITETVAIANLSRTANFRGVL
jgi:EAL domain-containing protein (putative c-di-GMP-specific phosphodiesterase class I)